VCSMIDNVLQEAVDAGAVPSVAAIAADRSGVIYEGGAGSTVVGRRDPIGVDTHFRIMSMTKMLTTVVALQQKEMDNLDFDAPVADYRPEFADLQVLEGFEGDTPRLRPPASQATVKQLVTHTAGLSYWFWNADILRWEAVTGTPNVLSGGENSCQTTESKCSATEWLHGRSLKEAPLATSVTAAIGPQSLNATSQLNWGQSRILNVSPVGAGATSKLF
jgi:Beta-lactamase